MLACRAGASTRSTHRLCVLSDEIPRLQALCCSSFLLGQGWVQGYLHSPEEGWQCVMSLPAASRAQEVKC